jgi:mannan endo-1,4-beta-mannosidase
VVGLAVLTALIALNTAKSSVASGATALTSKDSASSFSPSAATTTTAAPRPVSVAASPPTTPGAARRISIASPVTPGPPATIQTPGTPSVTSLLPNTVSAGGGAVVTIAGDDFGGASAVYFGSNTSSSFTVLSPNIIVATAPTNAGKVDVTVVTPLGTSADSVGTVLTYAPTGQAPISAAGQALEVNGVPTKFTGVNAYEIATSWGTNAGCGGMETPAQIAALFASLAPNSMVRFWAFQGTLGTDFTTHQIDWGPIDQVFYLAAQYHIYLVPAITDQGGGCDGDHWQDPSWYAGGYRDVFNTSANSDGRGLTPLSYWTYMQEVVNRYKNSPALGMWEPISEPEASSCTAAYLPTNCSGHQTCDDESVAAADLLSFFNVVGGEIHSLDPNHLVEGGFLGGGQCGTAGTDYEVVGASPGIDVLSVHDYYGSVAMGGDQWNGLVVRFSQAASLRKPIITGEVGILAGDSPSCDSFAQRDADMTAKAKAQFAAGSSAFLVWNWVLDPLGPCNYNTGPADSLIASLGGDAATQ